MERIPPQSDLTPNELSSLREISGGFRSDALPANQKARLVQVGLIYEVLGDLIYTAGRMVVRR
jgi:hypothetical protein